MEMAKKSSRRASRADFVSFSRQKLFFCQNNFQLNICAILKRKLFGTFRFSKQFFFKNNFSSFHSLTILIKKENSFPGHTVVGSYYTGDLNASFPGAWISLKIYIFKKSQYSKNSSISLQNRKYPSK